MLPARYRTLLLRLGGSVLLLGIVFSMVELDAIVEAFERVPGWLWLLTLGIHVALHLLQAAKWKLFVRLSGAGLPFGSALRCHAAGLFSSLGLPSLIGGDVLRAALAIRKIGHGESVVLGSLIDRLTDVLSLVILVGAGLVLAPSALEDDARHVTLWALAGVLGMTGLGVVAWLAVLRPAVVKRLPRSMARSLLKIRRALRTLNRSPGPAVAGLSLSLLMQAGIVVTAIAIGEMLGLNLDPRLWFLCYPLAKLATMLPISLGGLGVLELSFSFLVRSFADAQLAVALALVMQSVRIALGLVAGAYWLGSGWNPSNASRHAPGRDHAA